MTKIIGLTGGIGSGKTTVAKFFETMGVPIYYADIEAKKIMEQPEVLKKIKEKFGDGIFRDDVLDRKLLADLVFKDSLKLKELNELIHPEVRKHFRNWVEKNNHFPFVIKEAAILFESGSYTECYKIITVISPINSRIERVKVRDNVDSNAVLHRINNQWTDEMRIAKSDFVIQNTDMDITKKQVLEVFEKLKMLG